MRRPRAPRLARGRSHPPRPRLPPDAPGDTLTDQRLTDQSVARIITRRAQAAGVPPRSHSGHSLRAGYATAAPAAGIEERKIANVTRHKNLPARPLCGSEARGSADMTVSCPRCGGIQVRPIAPGLYACQTIVQAGWREDPPAMTGAGFQRHPVHGPCGNRFRPGGFRAAAGTRSGHARGRCQRRLCGKHGDAVAAFICPAVARGAPRSRRRRRPTRRGRGRKR